MVVGLSKLPILLRIENPVPNATLIRQSIVLETNQKIKTIY